MINFRSKITKKVLSYFFLNQDKELYLNEIARKFKVDRANLSRKLSEWTGLGIMEKEKKGNLSLYKINKKYPLLPEMTGFVQKSFGLEKKLREELKKLKGIEEAYIFGSYAKDELSPESDIDVLLIGSEPIENSLKRILPLQDEFSREFNTVDMSRKEFDKKIKNKDGFIAEIMKNKKIKII